MTHPACCSPSRAGNVSPPVELSDSDPAGLPEMVNIPAGPFRMGTDDDRFPADRAGPVRTVDVAEFRIATEVVTNDDFAVFVADTDLSTFAEVEGWSFVFGGLLPDDFPSTRGVVGAEWWRQVEGADWRHPHGPQSHLEGLGAHPVVHITWYEASAYAEWVGGRLPAEAEWEKAARGGLEQARYAWGDELTPGGVHQCNIWQGEFPTANSLDDGWLGPSPVRTYPPNGFGLHDMAGNVWEWQADWFDDTQNQRSMRGGSYLCHESYCNRYRVGARSSNTPDTPTGNIGFRVAAD